MNSVLSNAVKSLAEIGIHIPDAITSQTGQTLERLLKDNLLLSNRAGTTVAHAICSLKFLLETIPPDFLTEEILRITTPDGVSAAHHAARFGTLKLIPHHLITARIVDQQDNFSSDLLHYAAEGRCLRDIPLRFLTPQNIFNRTNSHGHTPIALTCQRLDHIPWESFKANQWLKFLSDLREVNQHPFRKCEALRRFVRQVEQIAAFQTMAAAQSIKS